MLLLGAAEAHEAGYFTLLRLVVCGTAVYIALLAREAGRLGWCVVLGITALLFNPIIIVRMERADWQNFDIGAVVLLTAAAWRFRLRKRSPD